MARMDAEQELALADARAEVARLHDEEKREQEQIIERRRDAEENAWTEIDHMTDKNKDVLAENIEKGLKNKAELTDQMRQLTNENLKKSNKTKELQEKKNQLEGQMVAQQKKRSDINALEQHYEARIATIAEKDI